MLRRGTFGHVIRDRRRQADLTQREIARRIGTSTPYVGHLESGKRHPSEEVISKIAEVLGFDRRELFFLANPKTRELVSHSPPTQPESTWEEFRRDQSLRSALNVSADEMDMLSRVALMGKVRSPRDFIYILNTVRQALEE